MKSPLAGLVLGALLGGALGAGAGALARTLAPPNYEGRALLLYRAQTDGGAEATARAVVAATLARSGFLADVVDRHDLDARSAAWLAGRLAVSVAPESDQLAALTLFGSDARRLDKALNAVVEELVAAHAKERGGRDRGVLEQLDAELMAATQRHEDLSARAAGEADLPMWARGAIVVLANLARQRLELEIPARYGLAGTDDGRQARLDRLKNEQAHARLQAGGAGNVERERFERELELAVTSARVLTLLQTKQALLQAQAEGTDALRIVQHARIEPRSLSGATLAIFALTGALLGTFVGGGMWWLRRPIPVHLSGPVVETDLHTRVVGVMASSLTLYGERKLRPLVQTHPEHLAVAGVRSLRVALHLLGLEHGRGGPVVLAEVGPPRHGAHVLANLAMMAADQGERVLLVEALPGASSLSSMFKSGTETSLSTTLDDIETLAQAPGGDEAGQSPSRRGRIRFVAADTRDAAQQGVDLPVPGAFVSYFDRVYIHASDAEQACRLLDGYGAGVGILVAGRAERLATLREVHSQWRDRSPSLHGIVLCGYRIDESAYLS